jgi:hypothetical protein
VVKTLTRDISFDAGIYDPNVQVAIAITHLPTPELIVLSKTAGAKESRMSLAFMLQRLGVTLDECKAALDVVRPAATDKRFLDLLTRIEVMYDGTPRIGHI